MVNVQLTLGSNASIFSFFAIKDFSSIHELSWPGGSIVKFEGFFSREYYA
jgi:hypothetical protein